MSIYLSTLVSGVHAATNSTSIQPPKSIPNGSTSSAANGSFTRARGSTFGVGAAEYAYKSGSYTGVSAQWPVPIGLDIFSIQNGQAIGFWDAIEGNVASTNFIVQPVLGFGCLDFGCSKGGYYWYIVAEVYVLSGNPNYSTFYRVTPGDQISGTVSTVSNPSNCGSSTPSEYLVQITDLTIGQTETNTYCYQQYGASATSAFGAALEPVALGSCNQFPASASEAFTSVSTNPSTGGWVTNNGGLFSPYCNYNIPTPSSSQITLQWAPTPGEIPALDGNAGGSCTFCTGGQFSLTLTTSQRNDILVAWAANAGGSTTAFTISDTAGLTWTVRHSDGNPDSYWYAKSANILPSDTITINGNHGGGESFLGQVFGVMGADFNSPFDPGFGASWSCGYGSSCTATVTTVASDDMLIALTTTDNLNLVPTQPYVFGQVNFAQINNGLRGGYSGTDAYNKELGTVTSQQYTWSVSQPQNWDLFYVDAFQPARPALDGSAVGSCTFCTGGQVGLTLSTSQPNDIIVAFAANAGGSTSTFTISDTSGLEWTPPRLDGGYLYRYWYAVSTRSLANDVITINGNQGGSVSFLAEVFGIRNANFNTPFDSGFPVINTICGNAQSCSKTVSTTTNNDLLVAFTVTDSLNLVPTQPSGFIQINNGLRGGYSATDASNKLVGTVTNQQYSWTVSQPQNWDVLIVDAVKPY